MAIIDPNNIGVRIKTLREKAGWTLQELADKIGTSKDDWRDAEIAWNARPGVTVPVQKAADLVTVARENIKRISNGLMSGGSKIANVACLYGVMEQLNQVEEILKGGGDAEE